MGWQLNIILSSIAVGLRLVTLSRDFPLFHGLALTRGQGDQDIIILPRTVDVLIQLTLFRATAIFFRNDCALCPRGLPWTTSWRFNIIMSSSTVVLWLITLSRVVFPFSDLA